ncbi:MAG: type II secretion system F family protein [Planctomycetota bacterium]
MNLTTDQLKLLSLLALWVACAVFGYVFYVRWRRREETQRRIYAEEDAIEERKRLDDVEQRTVLGRWLYLSGFRATSASAMFVLATLACLGGGALIAILAQESGITTSAIAAARGVPGGMGDLASPILSAGPWIFMVLLAMLPWSVVNSARKKRVQAVEQDMPVTLDLMSTLSESGLGFDSALSKVIESHRVERPLVAELKTFQLEVIGGISRVECFRRLARRLEVPSMTIFVSALVQAEQVGAGYARVLRIQADDLRNRRREEANMMAQALMVKLVFPLVICFLPGIFVSTLGPIFLQFVKLADSVLQGR